MGARSQTILFLLFHSFGGFGPKIKGGGGGGQASPLYPPLRFVES